MQFTADAMLGKLARWLRIMGFDTLYAKSMLDDEILARSILERRVLLTKDRALLMKAQKAGAECRLVRSDDIEGELAELAPLISEKPPCTRCPICNSILEEAKREMISSTEIPPIEPLWLCPSCGKVYWHGTHWKRIVETLEKIGRR